MPGPSRMVLIFSFLLLSFTSLARDNCSQCSTSGRDSLDITTTNGNVFGHIANGTVCVGEFLGIPYAKPPLDQLRFEAPQPITQTRDYEASQFGYDCPLTPSGPANYPGLLPQAQRILSYFTTSAGTKQSEDCLTLNIWSKESTKLAQEKRPVMVYFYGGRFTTGGTNSPFYTGKHFADEQNIVVVTVNYRLNIFGFPGTSKATSNLGLRDARLAVEWVRDNIQQFGGDASKITIVGQSSGGVAVDYWTYTYKQDPIIHAAIAHSGNALSFSVIPVELAQKNWDSVVAAVGCGDEADTMSCMRKLSWRTIEDAASKIKPAPSGNVLRSIPAFYPVPDGEVVFSNYSDLNARGDFVPVPILFGNNDNEAGFYRIAAYSRGIVPSQEQVDAFHLESFTCPVSNQVKTRHRHGIPSWSYRYLADWENTRLYDGSGAYHGVDLHMILGASEEVCGLPDSNEQMRLRKLMQKLWFSFMNDPAGGLVHAGWPPYSAERRTLAEFGQGNMAKMTLVESSKYDSKCAHEN